MNLAERAAIITLVDTRAMRFLSEADCRVLYRRRLNVIFIFLPALRRVAY